MINEIATAADFNGEVERVSINNYAVAARKMSEAIETADHSGDSECSINYRNSRDEAAASSCSSNRAVPPSPANKHPARACYT